MTGLRQLHREQVRDAISAAAISLFLARGFDEVPVAEIAAAARVSKPTLFKYFPAKEDLVLHRISDHQGEFARVVRQRAAGEHPLAALHRHFLEALARHDPVTGLNDQPEVMAFRRLAFGTPSVAARLLHFMSLDEDALTAALAEAPEIPDALTASLLAAQVLAAHRVLAKHNWQALADGRTLAEVEPEALHRADRAFALLRHA
ncbi:TetR family transcriptional regulator [Nonomuraea sp. NPDC049141]|uniref:TetR/AcrR family transcriptional regulator n=1 Tax=Nonomuraea sp. NPDC049141 TaxID=3155500 RepID=UPI0033D000F4